MAFLEISGLKKRFGAVDVLKGIDLELEKGGFLVLVGPSGCGKSTLLNRSPGWRRSPQAKSASTGRASTTCTLQARHRHGVPVLCALSEHDRGRQYRLRDGDARRAARRSAKGDRRGLRDMLQIEHLLDRSPAQLSGGQRQRVAMGRALVRNPQALPVRRAALQSRRQAARRHAHRDQAPASAHWAPPSSMSRMTRSRR